MPARAELHLAILNVISGGREQIVIPAVVVMHVRDDHVGEPVQVRCRWPSVRPPDFSKMCGRARGPSLHRSLYRRRMSGCADFSAQT